MFNRKSLAYFAEAAKNRRNMKWFEENRNLYEEDVRAPFIKLLSNLKENAGLLFPEVSFHSQKICLPVYRENIPEDGTLIKPFSWAFLAQKKTSMFEWNPGINLYFGDELSIGMGLYHPSSRQMKLLRQELSTSPDELSKILWNKKLRTSWGELSGEKFTRFPVGFDMGAKGSDYLWYKQFILRRSLTKKEFLSPGLGEILTLDLIAGAPFLHWLQETVGVYERPESRIINA